MEIKYVLPSEIEKQSFLTIEKELSEKNIKIPEIVKPVVMRVIHTTADFDYAASLCFSPDSIKTAQELLKEGAHIITDTNMAMAGINKKTLLKYGGQVHCFMSDEAVAKEAKERNVTRALVSMERASEIKGHKIFAIGNAPTALISLYEMMEKGIFTPEFVIGVPVGFVNVTASKELFLNSSVPFIINKGRKGGSNVAAAICNALLYTLGERE